MVSFANVGVLALACASTTFAGYVLQDDYSGESFYDGFDFATVDPTAGYVEYLTRDNATKTPTGNYLIKYESDTGANYMGVDHWSTLDPAGTGRASVRIESTATYTYGLFIIDLAHMPSSQYGLWPSFWMASMVDYPSQGEIDILENIHTATVSRQALHTLPGCTVSANEVVKQQLGTQLSYACDDISLKSEYGTQYTNEGCVAEGTDTTGYGDGFNANGGGVYATEWTSESIQIWFFGAGDVPSDITAGAPVPSSKWGKPAFTTANADCVIDDFFKDHHIILNTDFCGTWAAEAAVWNNTVLYDEYPTCADYVAVNPTIYKEAYWLINSIKVYSNSTLNSTSSSSSSSSIATSSSLVSSSSSVVATTSSVSSSQSRSASVSSSSVTSSSVASSSPTSSSSLPSSKASASSTSLASTTSQASASKISSPSSDFPISANSTLHAKPSLISQTGSSLEVSPATISSTGSISFNTSAPAASETRLPESTSASLPSTSLISSPIPSASTTMHTNSTRLISGNSTRLTTSTVYATSIYTVTSCAATITDCPSRLGSLTTELIPLSTTVFTVNGTKSCSGKKTKTKKSKSKTKNASSAAQTLSAALGNVGNAGNASQLTTSTVFATSVYTVTSCAPEVTNCPARLGSVTTEIIALYTTVCPIAEALSAMSASQTISPVSAISASPQSTLSLAAGVASSASIIPTSPESTLSLAAGVASSASVLIPASPQSTTSSAAQIASAVPSLPGNSESTISSAAGVISSSANLPEYTTSTVYATQISTVISCSPEITNCPASLVTQKVALYTTVGTVAPAISSLPEIALSSTIEEIETTFALSVTIATTLTAIETPTSSSSAVEAILTTFALSVTIGTTTSPIEVPTTIASVSQNAASTLSEAAGVVPSVSPAISVSKSRMSTTSTVYATSVRTISSCAASITDCASNAGQVVTDTVMLYTTVCPIEESEAAAGIPSPTSVPVVGSTSIGSSAPALSTEASSAVSTTSNLPIIGFSPSETIASDSIPTPVASGSVSETSSAGLSISKSYITRTETTMRTVSAPGSAAESTALGVPAISSSAESIALGVPTTSSAIESASTPIQADILFTSSSLNYPATSSTIELAPTSAPAQSTAIVQPALSSVDSVITVASGSAPPMAESSAAGYVSTTAQMYATGSPSSASAAASSTSTDIAALFEGAASGLSVNVGGMIAVVVSFVVGLVGFL